MEIEFKFQVPPQHLKAVEQDIRAATATRKHMQAHYFDTLDGALAARGVALRLRKEGTPQEAVTDPQSLIRLNR